MGEFWLRNGFWGCNRVRTLSDLQGGRGGEENLGSCEVAMRGVKIEENSCRNGSGDGDVCRRKAQRSRVCAGLAWEHADCGDGEGAGGVAGDEGNGGGWPEHGDRWWR